MAPWKISPLSAVNSQKPHPMKRLFLTFARAHRSGGNRMNITLDGRRYGQPFDFIIYAKETENPATK